MIAQATLTPNELTDNILAELNDKTARLIIIKRRLEGRANKIDATLTDLQWARKLVIKANHNLATADYLDGLAESVQWNIDESDGNVSMQLLESMAELLQLLKADKAA